MIHLKTKWRCPLCGEYMDVVEKDNGLCWAWCPEHGDNWAVPSAILHSVPLREPVAPECRGGRIGD